MTEAQMTFEQLAERTREAMQEMTEALIAEAAGLPVTQVLSALTAGTMCHAVQFFFSTCVSTKVPFAAGRAELDQQVDTYWKQALTAHLTNAARDRAEPPGVPTAKRRKRKYG